MRWTWITCIVLFSVAVLMLAFSLPVGAFDGVGAYGSPYSTYGSTSPYYSGLDGSLGGGWNQAGWPYQQQWQSPMLGSQYPYSSQYPYNYPGGGYQGGGYFSNCYSRCIAQGNGPNYCAQVCPV